MLERVKEVLEDVHYHHAHHFGRPFLTPYQLAIELDHRYPQIRQTLGVQTGGKGNIEHTSFSQYLARELSQRIGRDEITDIEGGFISNQHLLTIRLTDGTNEIESSLTETQFDLSLFRLSE